MNSTSFTSIELDCTGNNDKMAIIDSSSTAQLTLNASMNRPPRSTHGSNSDSDPDRSPSVTVLTTSGNNHLHHHHHHHPLTRPSQLITGGFSLSNRLHLTKHQRTLWSHSTSFEKLLMFAVTVLGTTTILLFVSLISVYLSHKRHFELEHAQTNTSANNVKQQNQQQQQQINESFPQTTVTTINGSINNYNAILNRNYCMTPDCVKVAASVIEAIDLTVDPCDDFYVSFSQLLLSTKSINFLSICLLAHLQAEK